MPSSIWTGSISFGLVQVPVKLVGATKSKDVSFNQLEKGTGARIRYRKVSDKTGDEVSADSIERGYEVSKGKYVIVEQSEIETLRPKGSHEIEIEEFVDLDDIDPLYFEQPYYLVPDKRGEKPYALLVDAMQSLNKVAIGRVVMRSKERLVAIRPIEGALCVETMRYADEVVPVKDLVPETDAELSEKERTMARQLVESLAVDGFDPQKYHDQYREQLLDLIARKESGADIVAEPQTEPPAKVLDLVAALEASIAKSKTAKDRHPTGAATRSRPAAKAAGAAKATKATASKATKAPAKKAARAKKSA
jgi:DNA end-binding protein Ku